MCLSWVVCFVVVWCAFYFCLLWYNQFIPSSVGVFGVGCEAIFLSPYNKILLVTNKKIYFNIDLEENKYKDTKVSNVKIQIEIACKYYNDKLKKF